MASSSPTMGRSSMKLAGFAINMGLKGKQSTWQVSYKEDDE
jgi:hypothetical protein